MCWSICQETRGNLTAKHEGKQETRKFTKKLLDNTEFRTNFFISSRNWLKLVVFKSGSLFWMLSSASCRSAYVENIILQVFTHSRHKKIVHRFVHFCNFAFLFTSMMCKWTSFFSCSMGSELCLNQDIYIILELSRRE